MHSPFATQCQGGNSIIAKRLPMPARAAQMLLHFEWAKSPTAIVPRKWSSSLWREAAGRPCVLAVSGISVVSLVP